MTTRTKTTETSVVLPDVGRRLAVLSDGSSVSVVGTEGAARIRFEAQGATARLVSSGTGGDVVVAEGTTAQIVDMFASLRAQAQPRRRVGIGTGTAAAAAVAAVRGRRRWPRISTFRCCGCFPVASVAWPG